MISQHSPWYNIARYGFFVHIWYYGMMNLPAIIPWIPYVNMEATPCNIAGADKFIHLISTLSRIVMINEEVELHMQVQLYCRLQASVWERRGIKLQTKFKVYQVVIPPSLLYACETWMVFSYHVKQLNSFHMWCLRKLLHIKWQDRIPDTEVLPSANMMNIHVVLNRSQLRLAWHVLCLMITCQRGCFVVSWKQGNAPTGAKRNAMKTHLKVSLKSCSIHPDSWEKAA